MNDVFDFSDVEEDPTLCALDMYDRNADEGHLAALVASCFRGAFPPVLRLAVCLVLAIICREVHNKFLIFLSKKLLRKRETGESIRCSSLFCGDPISYSGR